MQAPDGPHQVKLPGLGHHAVEIPARAGAEVLRRPCRDERHCYRGAFPTYRQAGLTSERPGNPQLAAQPVGSINDIAPDRPGIVR